MLFCTAYFFTVSIIYAVCVVRLVYDGCCTVPPKGRQHPKIKEKTNSKEKQCEKEKKKSVHDEMAAIIAGKEEEKKSGAVQKKHLS